MILRRSTLRKRCLEEPGKRCGWLGGAVEQKPRRVNVLDAVGVDVSIDVSLLDGLPAYGTSNHGTIPPPTVDGAVFFLKSYSEEVV